MPQNLDYLEQLVRPRTMEDIYREALRRGVDPSTYDPRAAPRPDPTLPSTEGLPRAPGPQLPPEILSLLAPSVKPDVLPRSSELVGPHAVEGPKEFRGSPARESRFPQVPGLPTSFEAAARDIGLNVSPEAAAGFGRQMAEGPGFTGPGFPELGDIAVGPGGMQRTLDLSRRLKMPAWLSPQAEAAGPEETTPMGAEEGLETLEKIRGGGEAVTLEVTGAEGVAEEAEEEADTEAETQRPGAFPISVEQPGDLARARAMERLSKLTALRSIAEGLGRPARVKGEVALGITPEPFRAEGIREAIGLEQAGLGDLAAEDKLRLQSKLRGEETAAELEQKFAGEKELLGATQGTLRAKNMRDERKRFLKYIEEPRGQLAEIDSLRALLDNPKTSTIEHAAAAIKIVKASGDTGRLSDQDIERALYEAGFRGKWAKLKTWFTGEMPESVKGIYARLADNLEKRIKSQIQKDAMRDATSFSTQEGIPLQKVLDSYGVTGAGTAGGVGTAGGDTVEVEIPGFGTDTIPRRNLAALMKKHPNAREVK